MSKLRVINCRTIIPKTKFIRKEFFTQFYFKIVKETDTEYNLDLEYRVNSFRLEEKLEQFAGYLNYALEPGDWIPFVIIYRDTEAKMITSETRIFTKYLPPSPFFYYGIYRLTEEEINNAQRAGCMKENFDTVYKEVSNKAFFIPLFKQIMIPLFKTK
jgi:hypothetical protein